MSKIESRTGIIKVSDEKIFEFLTDFKNFSEFVPKDKVKNFSATHDSCLFQLEGIGNFGFGILEKIPNTYIKYNSRNNSPVSIFLSVDILNSGSNSSQVKITIETDVNPFVYSLIKSPLQNLADTMIMQLEKLF